MINIIPEILSVVPNDNGQLIIEFNDSCFKIFSCKVLYENKDFSFLAYPNKLKSFDFSTKEVVWSNGKKLDNIFLYKNSQDISKDELLRQSLRVDYKNQAPTNEHKTHHVYEVTIHPFNITNPFRLAESIAGGLGDRGGSTKPLSIEELKRYNNWRRHFELSGCEWAINLIEKEENDPKKLLNLLVKEICKRSKFE